MDSDHKDLQSAQNAKAMKKEKDPSVVNPRKRFSFEGS